MTARTRLTRPRRRRRPPFAGTAMIVAAGALALTAVAYGGSLSETVGGGSSPGRRALHSQPSNLQKAIEYAHCMRSHGVRNWPDPNSSGVFPKRTLQQLGVSSSQLQTAETACRRLLPSGVGAPTQAELEQAWTEMRRFARCMRSHGVRTWPDPSRSPQHPERPIFNLQAAGIDPNAPQVSTRIRLCESLIHFRPSTNMLGG